MDPYLETSILLFLTAPYSYTPKSPLSYLPKPYLGPVPPLCLTSPTSLSPYPISLSFFFAPGSPLPPFSYSVPFSSLVLPPLPIPVSQTSPSHSFKAGMAPVSLVGALTGRSLVLCSPSLPSSAVYHQWSWFVSVSQLPGGRVLGQGPGLGACDTHPVPADAIFVT